MALALAPHLRGRWEGQEQLGGDISIPERLGKGTPEAVWPWADPTEGPKMPFIQPPLPSPKSTSVGPLSLEGGGARVPMAGHSHCPCSNFKVAGCPAPSSS